MFGKPFHTTLPLSPTSTFMKMPDHSACDRSGTCWKAATCLTLGMTKASTTIDIMSPKWWLISVSLLRNFSSAAPHAPLLFDETGQSSAFFTLSDILTFSLGHWKGHPPLRSLSIEHLKHNLDAADRAAFVSFLCLMLTWLPERRKGAKELLDHIWLSCKP